MKSAVLFNGCTAVMMELSKINTMLANTKYIVFKLI